ncbi:MAG TPA: metallophosphoesterase [Bryobacteraceae bacterium]|nr:metallophosphoesterase [Bryobacteraceae bacterium]
MVSRLHRSWIASSAVVALFAGVIGVRAVNEPKNDFRFSIIGDRTGGAQPEIYGRVWREVDLLHPDFVINVGDTIEGGNDATARSEWTELRPTWERYRHYPLYFTPGNHDIWSQPSRRVYEQETGQKSYYSFNYQEAHFTVLDNSQLNGLSDEQMRFLEQDLRDNKDRDPKFVFFHRPFWILPLKLGSGEFPLHKMVKQYGVQYVICGHGHQFVRIVRDGITYMEVGSSGGVMKGLALGQGFNQGWFYHHVWGRVRGSHVEFTVKELDPPKGQGRMFNAKEWDENGPKFSATDPAGYEKPQT